MSRKILSIRHKIGLILCLGILITVAALIVISTVTFRNKSMDAAREEALSSAREFATQIKVPMDNALKASKSLANALSAVGVGKREVQIGRHEAEQLAVKVLFSNPTFIGLTLAFEPNVFDGLDSLYMNTPHTDATGRFLSYVTKDQVGGYAIEPLIDYETPEVGPWYWKPKLNKRDAINGPVIYPMQGVDVLMVSYMTPVLKQELYAGVTGIDISIDYLQGMAKEANLFEGHADCRHVVRWAHCCLDS